MLIGVIAEDRSDIEVLYALTCKLAESSQFSFKPFAGGGCGMLRRKCTAWAENLLSRGCTHLVVIHDLDNNNEIKLRQEIMQQVKGIRFKRYIILIPVREIEAWLLADPEAIQTVFSLRKMPKVPKSPESILSAKEKLRDIVWQCGQKRYVNTIHNRKIAEHATLARLQICKSFTPYPAFIKQVFKT